MKPFPQHAPPDSYLQLRTGQSQHVLYPRPPWQPPCTCDTCRERRGERWDPAAREWVPCN